MSTFNPYLITTVPAGPESSAVDSVNTDTAVQSFMQNLKLLVQNMINHQKLQDNPPDHSDDDAWDRYANENQQCTNDLKQYESKIKEFLNTLISRE